MGAKEIIEEMRARGMSRSELQVLHLDPYLVGSEKDYGDARWAARYWDEMMAERKQALHLRGFHYWCLSRRIAKPNGIIYADEDAMKDWTWLLHAAQVARYLQIGSWRNLVDLKHPEPTDYDNYSDDISLIEGSEVSVKDEVQGAMDNVTNSVMKSIMKMLPRYNTEGYQTYHLEVWCEKSSMGFIIDPICSNLGALYQPLVGQASVEKVNMAVERARRASEVGKAVRIWYIADWDRYGWSMVSAVARKLEFFKIDNEIEADIKMSRLALNEDQIQKFRLPKSPKKGEAVVELDALEAIHQGELSKIIKRALRPYIDFQRPSLVEAENQRMRRDFRAILEEKLEPKIREIVSKIELGDIGSDIEVDEVVDHEFVPPDRGHYVEEGDDGWMYDSNIPWEEQLERFKAYKSEREEEAA